MEVICTLAERGLAFRGSNESFCSPNIGNYIGLFEIIVKFDAFLAAHIAKYGHPGRGHTSYLSKTICEEIIEEMSKLVREKIVQEVKDSGYFSISVDSTPDIAHIDQLSVIVRYVHDGQPVERFLIFIDMHSHTGEDMANMVMNYLCNFVESTSPNAEDSPMTTRQTCRANTGACSK